MNERIKELAKQSFQKCINENGFLNNTSWRINPDHYAESEVFEKFAELIVRECAELSVNSRYTNTKSEYYEGFNEALIYVGNKIKQHFAVEE